MTNETCVHHWIVELPNGPTSAGTCRLCGAVRDFPNSNRRLTAWGDNAFLNNPAIRRARFEMRENERVAKVLVFDGHTRQPVR